MAASSSSTVNTNQTEIGAYRTENVSVQVITLRLTKENYFPWSAAMTMGIAGRGRIAYIDGRNPESAKTSGQVKALDVIRKLTGKRSWPFLEKDRHQYLQLQELGETYCKYVNPASLSRSVVDKYKNSMVTCTVGLIFFNNEEHIMDFRIARLFRKWGHVKVRHMSIAMAALAFLYRGLTKFSIGDADSIEGRVFALQAWFYKNVGPQSCHSQNTDRQLSSMKHYRRKIEEVDDSTIIRYTYNPVRGSLLLGPFFIIEYHPERCLRQFSLCQRKAYPIELEGTIVECELDTEEWSGIYTYAQQHWESFAHLYLVLGPEMGPEYVNIRFMVETRSQSRRMIEMELDQPFIGDMGEESSSETPPKLEMNDPEFDEYRRFQKYKIMFNEEQAQTEKAKKKGKKTKKYSSSSSDSFEDTTTTSSSEEEQKTPKKKKKGES
ncbi:hypothetical protein EJ110_NYTH51709 [Nymphaea thermarum]|nr:hypothetical protein EJ110_NYTH51709 [Nymphaea thermarum]